MNSFEILAKIYDILGASSVAELDQAANVAGSAELRDAILALSKAKRGASHPGNRSRVERSAPLGHLTPISFTYDSTEPAVQGEYRERLHSIVFHSKLFPTTKQLADYLNATNMGARFRGRDGRKEIFTRLVSILDRMDPAERELRLIKLIKSLPTSQTSGWIRVIRGEKA